MKTVIIICFCSFTLYANAQTPDAKTDSVFQLVKQYFNEKDANAIYALAGENFHKALSQETFLGISTNQIFPAGKIKKSELIERNGKVSKYKLIHELTTLQLLMSLDTMNKIELFLFQPYQPPVANKKEKVLFTNPLVTSLDSLVDKAAQSFIIKENTVGLSIGVLQNNKFSIYGYGETKKGANQIPAGNTLFEIGSITKTFTATLLAWYVNKGKIKLNDPITKYLPDSVRSNKALQTITFQMLSNHTSGLPRLPDNMFATLTDSLNPYEHYNKGHLYSFLKKYKAETKPGTKHAYSNLGVGLLGTLLENVSGKTFETMVIEIICKPLGMKHTMQYVSNTNKDIVTTYNENKPMPLWDFKSIAPAGALKSSALDLLLYAKANIKNGSDALSKAFAVTQKPTYTKDQKVGLGWFIAPLNNKEIYTHSGGTYGSSSFIAFNKEKGVAVVVLSNAFVNTDQTGMAILKELIK